MDQETPGSGAVDLGCLDELIGDRQKELAEQRCRRRRGDQRENQAGIGVDQAEIGGDLVGRDDPHLDRQHKVTKIAQKHSRRSGKRKNTTA